MKTRSGLQKIRRSTIWAGRLMLAALLCLDAWWVCRVAHGWPRVAQAATLQAYPVDIDRIFGAR